MNNSGSKKSENNAGTSLKTESRTEGRELACPKNASDNGLVIKVTKGGSSGPSGHVWLKKE
jgi:hypothetical protein